MGRRRRPINPPATADGLQEFINEQFKESGHRLTPRGVFRFHSHEEADAWMRNSIRPKKAWLMERTHREKDRAGLQFLRENYAEEIFGEVDQV